MLRARTLRSVNLTAIIVPVGLMATPADPTVFVLGSGLRSPAARPLPRKASMKKLINAPESSVPEMLAGLVATSENLHLMAGTMTVARADSAALVRAHKVAVVSGGGAGHEPAHAGYVGTGLLTAAVSGDVFTSPSTDAVLDAIREVGGPAGVLLVVKNYTGDVLNFGLAGQLARAEGIPVEIVVVRDDVALIDLHGPDARRGLAGTVLIHKIAGAAAEAGKPLTEVAEIARKAASGLWTMGVGLGPCTVPAAGKPNFVLADDEIEWGLGIHGEAGISRSPLRPADEIVDGLLDTILRSASLAPGSRVALLVNNLGGTPRMELDIVARAALRSLQLAGFTIDLVWVGSYLTALEMPGCSLTVLESSDEIVELLRAPARSAAWRDGVVAGTVPVTSVPPSAASEAGSLGAAPVSGAVFTSLEAACSALIAAEETLTAMDQIVGDGDLGISLHRGSQSVLDEFARYAATPSPAEVLERVSATIRRSIGGTSGPLYASLILGAAVALRDHATLNAKALGAAFTAGVQSVSTLGGAKLGDRTMMDALIPAAEAFSREAALGQSVAGCLEAATEAARLGSESTATMVASKGRSRYIGDRALGTADPGAHAVVIWLDALRRSAGEGAS